MDALFDPAALALGMVGLLNPCGFALFPAYLGYFLGAEDGSENDSWLQALSRAQVVGLSLSAGFVLVFALFGVAFAGVAGTISPYLATTTLVIGLGLTVLGISMIFGFKPLVSLPNLDAGGDKKTVASMFVFGISYAVASLTCTLPLFLLAVGTASSGESFGQRFGSLLSYGVGMGLLATVLTLLMAFGKKSLVNSFKQILPKVNRISGVIIVIVGLYLAYYGYWSRNPTEIEAGPVEPVERAQQWVNGVIEPVVSELALGFLIINLIIVAAALAERMGSGSGDKQMQDA